MESRVEPITPCNLVTVFDLPTWGRWDGNGRAFSARFP